MKTYCFDQTEINLVLKCLRYAVEYGYTAELSDDECSEYVDLKELIDRIDPKPVKKEGWIVLYGNGMRSPIFDSRLELEGFMRGVGITARDNPKIVPVTWEV